VGHTAPPDFISNLNEMASAHDDRIELDCIRAYHNGALFNVEIEIVLPAEMTVRESHDIALALQHKVEMLDEVERCFVHVDYQTRDGLEHKIERTLTESLKAAAEVQMRSFGALPFGIRLRVPQTVDGNA
jgi:divalent metal cation (Fe/Co/Zn/Cd) transporter